jgi:FdhD protein
MRTDHRVGRQGLTAADADVEHDAPTRTVPRGEWIGAEVRAGLDEVVREEPLEIRVGAVPIAVVMRTPGHDLELARGFAITERIVEDPLAITSVRHCTRVEHPDAEDNIVQLVLRSDVVVDLARLRRNLYSNSSCGICGKATIEQALAVAPPLSGSAAIEMHVLRELPHRLRAEQAVFARTGGLHAAGLFDRTGTALVVREDVGRHNAVDKVVGWTADTGAAIDGGILMVSGRVSFEIVQKALAARIGAIAAVSAPSSLAIELAQASNIVLVGFLRDDRACVYAGDARVTP